jgi:hypothetical protein|eukprot:COSAG01_NODE_3907_length_5556_cov_8.827378_4_plen_43_part_00
MEGGARGEGAARDFRKRERGRGCHNTGAVPAQCDGAVRTLEI